MNLPLKMERVSETRDEKDLAQVAQRRPQDTQACIFHLLETGMPAEEAMMYCGVTFLQLAKSFFFLFFLFFSGLASYICKKLETWITRQELKMMDKEF